MEVVDEGPTLTPSLEQVAAEGWHLAVVAVGLELILLLEVMEGLTSILHLEMPVELSLILSMEEVVEKTQWELSAPPDWEEVGGLEKQH